jgi:hypothetical protein
MQGGGSRIFPRQDWDEKPKWRRRLHRMDVQVGDILIMKKNHPCGENKFLVLRSGMDFKLRCTRCGREVMVARSKAEKNIREIQRP